MGIDTTRQERDDYWERQQAERLKAYERRVAEWEALPPIKRIETWHEVNGGASIGIAFQRLGLALTEWAKEQQGDG